jgi:peptidyl-prolyl cis-trans isomerase C
MYAPKKLPMIRRLPSLLVLGLCIAACDGGDKSTPEPKAGESASKSADGTDGAKDKQESGDAAAQGDGEKPDWLPAAPIGSVAGADLDYDQFVALYTARKAKAKGKKVGKSVERRSQIAIIDRLILEQQLRLEAKAIGVDYAPEELEKSEVEQFIQGKDREEFLAWMGETDATYRERTIADLRERAILKATSDLGVTEADIKEAYEKVKPNLDSEEERVRASHIFIAIGPRKGSEKIRRTRADRMKAATPEQLAEWEAAALVLAKEAREKVMVEGVDFAEMAKELSEGPGAYRGGDMGIFDRRRMLKEYSDAAFSMKVGEISQPVKAHDAYYIIHLDSKHPPGTLSLEDVRPDLVRDVENRKFVDARKALRESLNEKYPPVNVIKQKNDDK